MVNNKGRTGVILLVVLLSLALFALSNVYAPRIAKWYYNKTFTTATTSDNRHFEELLRNAVYKTIKDETWNSPLGNYETLLSYLSQDVSVFDYGEFGLLMHYAYMYAQAKSDNGLKELVKEKFDNRVFGNPLRRCDQVTYGNVAIDLYLATEESIYKEYADYIFEQLDSLDNADGVIKYNPKLTEQRVDGIGLVCPFLFYYSSVFGCEEASLIGNKMALDYVKFGVDPETGIPTKAYGFISHIKHNSSNWGRGISWYLLGTKDMDKSETAVYTRLDKLDSALLSSPDFLYTRFYDEEGLPDMSVTIPVILYLYEKRLINLTKDKITKLVSPFCDNKGVLRFCSPVLYSNTGVNNQESSLYAQGVLLYLFSLAK